MWALAVLLSLAAVQDTTVFPPRETLIRLYTNCDEPRWPWGLEETFVTKSDSELAAGVTRLHDLENGWRTWFAARAGDSITITLEDAWVYPLAVRGRLL